jgi:hypothetical protein
MQNSKSIFLQSLKENKESPRHEILICKDVEEIATKKLQRLKSDAYIQKRVRELFEIFYEALKEEDLINEKHVASVIDGLIKSASANETSLLFTRIYEKEQLEKWIDDQRLQIKNLIQLTYENLEEFIKDGVAKTALQDSKLRGIEMLGILKETTQEALLTTVEKGDDILDTVLEITKSISYQAINEGDFTKERFLDIAKAIVEVCIETADASQAFAKELLNGGVHGTKEGIVKAVEKFKNDLKFAPEEVEALLDRDLSETRKELIKIEDEYIQMLKNLSKKSSGVSKEMLGSPDKKTGHSFYAGVQIPGFLNQDKIGFEYNYGSKYWRSFTYGEDTLVGSKLATRGSAYETYYILPLLGKNLTAQIRYTYMDYKYTGSDMFFGQTGKPQKTSETPGAVKSASDLRLSLRYRY